jgi:hypothetical protein
MARFVAYIGMPRRLPSGSFFNRMRGKNEMFIVARCFICVGLQPHLQ